DKENEAAPEFPIPDAWVGNDADEGYFTTFTTESAARVDGAWFRGGGFDPLTMLWNTIATGKAVARAHHPDGKTGGGGSLYVPFKIKGRTEKTIRLLMAWYVPRSAMRVGGDSAPVAENGCAGKCACGETKPALATYVPWYAARFKSIEEVTAYWRQHYDRLNAMTRQFSDCFYDTTLPAEVVEAAAANLTILKSPTCLRDAEGRFWGWEGCGDAWGCCHGSCTHVWNYAQALPHLFPNLERSLRETEFGVCQDERGHQTFRASLPIRAPDHAFHAAADGQLGGIIKLYREWRISGDSAWMQSLWPKARQSLDYCIASWDPDHTGALVEPHHNTYDIEFWGADGMCTSFYLGALKAAIVMGKTCGAEVRLYEDLLAKGKQAMESTLWNREYFFQKVQWKGLRATDPARKPSPWTGYVPEALEILKKEGPKYQYGTGCLADGVLGDWLTRVSGLNSVLDSAKVARHLASVFRYNYRPCLADHANPQRPGFAFGQEGGLLLCSWPRKRGVKKPSLPFIYSDEVWTGIEYQVASHLMLMGRVREGLAIVRACRDRYDGTVRNPFDEYECGHWYARALSSYALLQGLTGARYDAVEKILYLRPSIKGDFRAFLATATGFGTVGVRNGKPFLKVVSGQIDVARIEYQR
ncbi:MAG: glycoside hydrolase family 116 protein, partial [Verrucomicrobia bacterium]|nr:glycoside hydrolase family 116 protein [Verrucomicrobiota bacterium]